MRNLGNEVKELVDSYVLNEVAQRYGIDITTLNLIGNFQNIVYEYKKWEKSYILRFTHSTRRKEEMVRGELDWISYLTNNGVPASRPVYSMQGKLTERIDLENSYFSVTSFKKAMGEKISYPEYINNDKLFEECGRITGKIHCLSKKYKPSQNQIKRHEWIDNYYLKNIKKYIPKEQHKVFESYNALINIINKLSKDSNSFGIIHGDINIGNFVLGDNGVEIFDFDECQYSWFVEDIAIQLFYLTYVFLDDSISDRDAQGYRFIENFMKGYYKENYIDEYWLKQIPTFLKLREIIVYIGICRSVDLSNSSEWTRNYILQSKSRIEQSIPIVSGIVKN